MNPHVRTPIALSAEQLGGYEEQGFLIVRGLLNTAEVGVIKSIHAREVEASMHTAAAAGWTPKSDDWDFGPGGVPAVRKVSAPFDRFPEFRAIFAGRAVLDIVADLIGPDIYLHSSKLMCKPARAGRRKPWHQDLAYWEDIDWQQVTLWCAADPARRENGCLQLIPGSHRRGLIRHEQIDDWQIREDGIDEESVFYAEMEPGDVMFLDVLTLHSSGPNRSDEPRLAALVNYISAPPRAGQTSPYGSKTPLR